MACTKTQLVSAINSYAAARATGDGNLQAFSAQLVEQFINTLEFAPEEEAPAEEEKETEAE